MICQPQGQRNDRECRVRLAGGGKYGATRYVQVLHSVDRAVAIRYTFPRIIGHPGGTNVMKGFRQRIGHGNMVVAQPGLKAAAADTQTGKFSSCIAGESCRSSALHLTQSPIDQNPPQTQGVALRRKRYAAFRVGSLLQVEQQNCRSRWNAF